MARRRQRGWPPRSKWAVQSVQFWVPLAVQFLILMGLVVLALLRHLSGLLYAMLALALAGVGLQSARFAAWQEGRRTVGLDQRLARLLAETPDPATAVFRAVSLLQEALGVGRAALFACDSTGSHAELLSEAHTGECTGTWAGHLAVGRFPVLAEALQGGQAAFWADAASLPVPPEIAALLTAGLPSLSLHPLVTKGASVGFLALAATHPRRLSRLYRQPALEAAALVLALYIRTAGLQPDTMRAQDKIELLYEVTTQLNTDLSLEKVMSNVLTQAMAKVGATRGSIFLLDKGRVTNRILGRENLAPEVSALITRSVMERGLAAWIMKHKQGTVLPDVLEDERWVVLPDHGSQVRSAVAVPFLHRGEVQGMLFLTHPAPDRFRQEHLDLLTSLANQAAIAIQNARLYERAQNERLTLAAVLDSCAEAIIVTDPAGQIILANSAAHQSLGVENRPVPLQEVLYHTDLLAFLERAASREGAVSENVHLSDGRTLSVSVAPFRDREGQTIGRVAVMHDITYLIELDEVKSRFVSTVSHDLKAPLTAIRGFADLIGAIGPLNEEQAQFIARVREITEGMTHLVTSLLDLGRIEAGLGIEVQPVNVRDILVSSKYDLSMQAQQKSILVEVEAPADLLPVEADPFRLQQVLSNLLGNAIKYTPPGGRVWLRADSYPTEILVSVTDTGIGIPPADLPHVFDKFYRVRDPRTIDQEGSGLGLAIVKSIVHEHGGRVWAESTPGKGSTFCFTLPLPQKPLSPPAETPPAAG